MLIWSSWSRIRPVHSIPFWLITWRNNRTGFHLLVNFLQRGTLPCQPLYRLLFWDFFRFKGADEPRKRKWRSAQCPLPMGRATKRLRRWCGCGKDMFKLARQVIACWNCWQSLLSGSSGFKVFCKVYCIRPSTGKYLLQPARSTGVWVDNWNDHLLPDITRHPACPMIYNWLRQRPPPPGFEPETRQAKDQCYSSRLVQCDKGMYWWVESSTGEHTPENKWRLMPFNLQLEGHASLLHCCVHQKLAASIILFWLERWLCVRLTSVNPL